jgi:hypothetical protein
MCCPTSIKIAAAFKEYVCFSHPSVSISNRISTMPLYRRISRVVFEGIGTASVSKIETFHHNPHWNGFIGSIRSSNFQQTSFFIPIIQTSFEREEKRRERKQKEKEKENFYEKRIEGIFHSLAVTASMASIIGFSPAALGMPRTMIGASGVPCLNSDENKNRINAKSKKKPKN